MLVAPRQLWVSRSAGRISPSPGFRGRWPGTRDAAEVYGELEDLVEDTVLARWTDRSLYADSPPGTEDRDLAVLAELGLAWLATTQPGLTAGDVDALIVQQITAAAAAIGSEADRQEEWAEFLADCGKFDAEIDNEVRNAKFTMAALEEEEHSLERLRRWHRELKTRDVFGAPTAAEAKTQLTH